MSSIEAGGYVRPSRGAESPVALHTAVHSIAGLEPSRNELNILGLRPPIRASSAVRAADPGVLGVRSVVAPYGLRCRLREMRQPFVPAAGGDDGKAGRARPVDQVADECGLVAIRQAVDDARGGRPAG